MKRLIVKWRDGYCNLPVTRIVVRDEAVAYAYHDEEFIGMFDLGAIELLYVSEREPSA